MDEFPLQIEGYQEVSNIAVFRAGKILYNLTSAKKTHSATVISVILDIEAQLDSRTVIIRSPLQVRLIRLNHYIYLKCILPLLLFFSFIKVKPLKFQLHVGISGL